MISFFISLWSNSPPLSDKMVLDHLHAIRRTNKVLATVSSYLSGTGYVTENFVKWSITVIACLLLWRWFQLLYINADDLERFRRNNRVWRRYQLLLQAVNEALLILIRPIMNILHHACPEDLFSQTVGKCVGTEAARENLRMSLVGNLVTLAFWYCLNTVTVHVIHL